MSAPAIYKFAIYKSGTRDGLLRKINQYFDMAQKTYQVEIITCSFDTDPGGDIFKYYAMICWLEGPKPTNDEQATTTP